MTKYIITYNCGYGDTVDLIEADSLSEAENAAYEAWNEDAQSQADYSAMEFTLENAEEWDLETQHPDYVEEEE